MLHRHPLLGYSIAQIQEANGWKVVKTNIVNDRGIHICKSMLAWLKFGNGETPETSGKKGDHLIGDYYVRFDIEYKKQIAALMAEGKDEETAKREAPLMLEAQEMLRKWEANDPEVRGLWARMNEWVYAGFDETYKRMGVSFDKIYYESNTYLEGKSEVEKGLAAGQFYRREDGSPARDRDASRNVSYLPDSGMPRACSVPRRSYAGGGASSECTVCRGDRRPLVVRTELYRSSYLYQASAAVGCVRSSFVCCVGFAVLL